MCRFSIVWLVMTAAWLIAIAGALAAQESIDLPDGTSTDVHAGKSRGLIGRYYAGSNQPALSKRPSAVQPTVPAIPSPTVVRIDPLVAFDWSDGTPDERIPAGPLTVFWSGEVYVTRDGQYRFAYQATGDLRVYVDDQFVGFDADRTSAATFLERGFHAIHIRYTTDGQTARVKLFWESEHFSREVLGARYLMHRLEEEEDFADQLAYQQGRDIVHRYGCAGCHPIPGMASNQKPGPPLNRVGLMKPVYLRRWLADPQCLRPGTRMPAYRQLRESSSRTAHQADVQAIAAFLRSLPVDPEAARRSGAVNRYRQKDASTLPSGSPKAGRQQFHMLGCSACHAPESPGTHDAATAPSLADMGLKWTHQDILRFLEDPLVWHPHGRMPDFQLTENMAADLAAYLSGFVGSPTSNVDGSAEQTAAGDHSDSVIARGKELVQQLGCAACHDIPGVETPPPDPPLLPDRLNSQVLRGCLASAAVEPDGADIGLDFSWTPDERSALVQFLRQWPEVPSRVALEQRVDRRLQSHFQCFACHARDAAGGEPLTRATLRFLAESRTRQQQATDHATGVASVNPAALVAPDLSGIGQKLLIPWLREAVAGQARSPRPWLTLRMPKFAMDAGEPEQIASHLAWLDSVPQQSTPQPPDDMADELQANGATLLGPQGFSCIHCHHLGKHHPVTDTPAPDLSMVSQRITRPWFLRWLKDPAQVHPGTVMPAFVVPARDIAGGDLSAQREILWQYLSTTPPDKIALAAEPTRLIRVGSTHPVVVQGRVSGPAPLDAVRGVAIGLPNGHGLLFDAGRLAWLGHWQGEFLREVGGHGAHHHWLPAGTPVWQTTDLAPPIAFRNNQTGQWIAPALWRGRFGWLDRVRFAGHGVQLEYRLRFPQTQHNDPDSGPWVRVRDQVEPDRQGGNGYARRLAIENLPSHYDAVVPVPVIGSSIQQLDASIDSSLADASAESAAWRSAAVVSLKDGQRHMVRVTAAEDVSWIAVPETITYPVLQPLTDQPVQPDQRFDSEIQSTGGGVAVLLRSKGTEQTHVLTMEIQLHAGDATVTTASVRPDDRPDAEPAGRPAELDGPAEARVEDVPVYTVPPQRVQEIASAATVTVPAGYGIERLPLPDDFLVCGLTFWKGKLLAGGYDGEIRVAEDADGDGLPDRYRYFAGTLDQVNNLRCFEGRLYATSAGAVYRIDDRNEDGVADTYDVVSSAWDWAGHPFDWFFGLAQDRQGNLYGATTTPYERPADIPGHYLRGSVLQITPDGKTVKVGDGTRYNFGWASDRAGRVYFNVNQGHWNITCAIHEVAEGAHYGYGEPDLSKVKKPIVYVPYPWCRALTGMVFAESAPPFGPFQGHGLVADYNTRRIIRWTQQKVAGQWQGACYPFLDGLDAGPTDMVFGPDGALYVGFMSDGAWYPERPRGGIYRVRFCGPPPFAIREGHVTPDGLAVQLTEPADPNSINTATCRKVHRYFHQYQGIYHSQEVAHEDVTVQQISLSPDGRTILLNTGAHVAPRIYRIELRGVRSASGQPLESGELYFTMTVAPCEEAGGADSP